MNCINTLPIAMLVVVIILTSADPDYTVKRIRDSGAMFEETGTVHWYRRHWTILSRIPIPNFNADFEFLENCTGIVGALCQQLHILDTRCKSVGVGVNSRLNHLRGKLVDLDHYLFNKKNYRQKRAFFDGVGSLGKLLFGTMDNNDNLRVTNLLADLDKRENTTFHLLKDQITVMKSNFQLFNESRVQAENDRQKMFHLYSTLVPSINNQSHLIRLEMQRTDLSELMLMTILEMDKIADSINTITEIIVASKMGKMHPAVVHSKQLSKIMHSVLDHSELDPRILNHQTLTQIIKVQVVSDEANLLVRIDVPQPEKMTFTIYRIYSVPVRIDDSRFYFYNIEGDFLAANKLENQYAILSQKGFDTCNRLVTTDDENHFICERTIPTSTTTGTSCILNLYKGHSLDTSECVTKWTRKWNTFVKMETKNHWLYIIGWKIKIEIHCLDAPTRVQELNNVGVISLHEQCSFRSGDTVVYSLDNTDRNLTLWQPEERPEMSLKIDESITLNQLNQLKINTSHLPVIQANNLNSIWQSESRTVDDLVDKIENESHRRNQNQTSKIHMAISATSASLTGLVVIIVAILWRLCWKKTRLDEPISERKLPSTSKEDPENRIRAGTRNTNDKENAENRKDIPLIHAQPLEEISSRSVTTPRRNRQVLELV